MVRLHAASAASPLSLAQISQSPATAGKANGLLNSNTLDTITDRVRQRIIPLHRRPTELPRRMRRGKHDSNNIVKSGAAGVLNFQRRRHRDVIRRSLPAARIFGDLDLG